MFTVLCCLREIVTIRGMTVTETLREQLLHALEKQTLYKVAKETGVNWDSLRRFARNEGNLRGEQLDALADYLGLELKRTRKPRSSAQ